MPSDSTSTNTDLVDTMGDTRPDPEWDDEANGVEVSQDELNEE